MSDFVQTLCAHIADCIRQGTAGEVTAKNVECIAAHIEALQAERDELRAWDDYFRLACGYKRDGRSSPECLDETIHNTQAERDAAVLALADIGSPAFIRPIVEEQSCGEWGDDIVDQDTAKICAAIRARSKEPSQ